MYSSIQPNSLQILSDNAYSQRMYPHEEDFDPTNARIEGEKLHVNIPGKIGSNTVSLCSMETRPFYVYTRKECEEYLQALQTAFKSENLYFASKDGDDMDTFGTDLDDAIPSQGTNDGSLLEGIDTDLTKQSFVPEVPTQMLPQDPRGAYCIFSTLNNMFSAHFHQSIFCANSEIIII